MFAGGGALDVGRRDRAEEVIVAGNRAAASRKSDKNLAQYQSGIRARTLMRLTSESSVHQYRPEVF